MRLLIRRSGTLIDVSPDGRSPLPEQIRALLEPHLVYEHLHLLHGHQAWDADTGRRERVKVEVKNMFRYEDGRLTTGYGFIPKILRILQAAGHETHYYDVSPPRQRPDCYTPAWDNLRRYFEPRARQLECLEVISNTWGGVINATMGFGKTHMFGALAHLYPRAKFAIVVESRDVAAKIVRRLTAEFPNIGHIGGGKKQRGDRITVFTAGSMHHSDGDFDFLLCDEAHQLMSPKHSAALGENFRFTRNYAFTATPDGRMDGAHAKLEMFFGPEIFTLPYAEAAELGLVVPIRVRWLTCNIDGDPGNNKSGVPLMRWGIWRNQLRNKMFADDVRESYPDNQQILMAVATLDHAIHLWQFLPEFTLCYSNTEEENLESYRASGMLPRSFQSMTSTRRENYRNAFESGELTRVIATDIWSTGVDFERLQVLYRCDARASQILDAQWPGRTSRLYDGKQYGEIVDSIDSFNRTLLGKSQTRKRNYNKQGWSHNWPVARRQNAIHA